MAGGVALALLVAFCFAANSTLAALAYAGGSNALSVLVVRSSAAFVILAVVLVAQRRSLRLPTRERNVALMLGVVMAMSSYGLLGAMEHMPVALCVITLYTYPFLVAAVGWLTGETPFSGRFALALTAAFVGLVFALDLTGGAPSATGIALSFVAAVGVAIIIVVSERERHDERAQPFTLYTLGSCMLVAFVVGVTPGEFAFPHTPAGWFGFIGGPLCYSFAIIFLFVVIGMIGSLRASLLMNLEPVSSVLLAYLLLAQSLGWMQLLGIAVVIAAVVAIEGSNTATPVVNPE